MREISGVAKSSLQLALILSVGLIHGLLYIFFVPPWQHYDEPNHFEFAWLIAQRGQLPQPEDYDPAMRRAVAESMIAAGFFRGLRFLPDLNVPGGKVWIGGYSQLSDPPLYYVLVALPLWALADQDVTTQLYWGRAVSLILYLFTLLIAWLALRDLTRPGSPLRWLVPLTMALLPGFTDVMTAINNDVGATAFFTLYLWACLRLVRDGFSWKGCLWVLVATAACLGVKTSVWVALPLLLPVFLLAIARGRAIWLAFGVLAALGSLMIPALFSWQETSAYWYAEANQVGLGRRLNAETPWGDYVFVMDTQSGSHPLPVSRFRQLIPFETLQPLAGKTVTLGAWMWASRPVLAASPRLHVAGRVAVDYGVQWPLTVQPTFHAFTLTLPLDASRAWVDLAAITDAPDGIQVYADGLVLVAGARPLDQPPNFSSAGGESGWWNGVFENLLRGASAENGWPEINPQADALSARLLPDQGRLSLLLYTMLDGEGAGAYYRATLLNLLQTFWARFGWGQVPLLYADVYWVLGSVSLLAVLTAVGTLFWQARQLPWAVLLVLGLGLALVWGSTLARGAIYSFQEQDFIPSARYALPAILPTALIWAVGWRTVGGGMKRVLHLPGWLLVGGYVLVLLALDALALVSIVQFYT
jgi:hypothetical protein